MLKRNYGAHAVIRQRDELMTWLQLFTKTLIGKSAQVRRRTAATAAKA